MLLLHVRFAREDAAKRGTALAVPDLADTLRRLGYAVKIRTALGGGSGGACLRSLRHSFLTVSVAGPTGAATYVVDPRFRDQVRHWRPVLPAGVPAARCSLMCLLSTALLAKDAASDMAAACCRCCRPCADMASCSAGFPARAHPPVPRPPAPCSLRLRTPRLATRASWLPWGPRWSARKTA